MSRPIERPTYASVDPLGGPQDVTERPAIEPYLLTFTPRMKRFEQLVANMDESFLSTPAWDIVRARMEARVA